MADQKLPVDRTQEAIAAMRQAAGKPEPAGNGRSVIPEPQDAPIATIVSDWMQDTNRHFQRQEEEVTRRWAQAMLDIDRRRSAYYQQMLTPLAK